MTSKHLLPGTIDGQGRVAATPVIVELDASGRVVSFAGISAHEPCFTTPLRALLHLPTLTLREL